MKKKQVQIDESLFKKICFYFGSLPTERTPLEEEIFEGLYEKLNARVRRNKFTAYKTAAPGEERDQARKDYLDEIGVTESYFNDDEIAVAEEEPP